MKRRLSWVFAGFALAVVAGCYQQTSENGTFVYKHQAWVAPIVALVGVAFVPVGVLLFAQKRRLWGVCLAVGGPIAAVVVAPTMYLDRVVVNDESFSSRHGFWWDPTVEQIRYEDLTGVQYVVKESIGRRGRKNYSYYFDCSFKKANQKRVPLGDLMRQALPEITARFQKHGIPFLVPPNLP